LALPVEQPILCTASRITPAKGFRFLLRNLDALLSRGVSLVVAGDGDPKLLRGFQEASVRHPDRMRLITPYSEETARKVLAGADMLIMPSLVEPCGLTQMQAQAYGCVPVVSAVGGLSDSIRAGGGFLFEPSSRRSFAAAIDDAIALYNKPARWRRLQGQCMASHRTNHDPGQAYLSLYRVPPPTSAISGDVASEAPSS
jgi:starch synthase